MKRRWKGVAAGLLVALAAGSASSLAAATAPQEFWGNLSGGPYGYAVYRQSQMSATSQLAGLVLIDTEVQYGSAAMAGTGLVLDPSGLVVTNHHVVVGSTSVSVTVGEGGKSYDATVLGYDTTDDVAVLKLDNAPQLTTVVTSNSPAVTGQSITAIGNASGGGQLVATAGQVTGTGVSITVQDETGGTSARLHNLIEVNAKLVPGDSGGALLNAANQVVGMNVAGSSNPLIDLSYAIPIATVHSVVDQVTSRQASSTVTIGAPAALGINGQTGTGGVLVTSVAPGSAANGAGLTVGDTITSFDGTSLTSLSQLQAGLSHRHAGDVVAISWTTRGGAHKSANLALGQAPLP